MYFSTLFLPFWRSKYILVSIVTKLCHKKSSSFSVLFLMGAADFYVSTLTAVVLQKKHYSRHQQEPCQFHLQDRYTQQIYYRVTHKRNCHLVRRLMENIFNLITSKLNEMISKCIFNLSLGIFKIFPNTYLNGTLCHGSPWIYYIFCLRYQLELWLHSKVFDTFRVANWVLKGCENCVEKLYQSEITSDIIVLINIVFTPFHLCQQNS